MNTLSSSSICVFLRISDLALSFASSSCFFCFKVWEKNRTEHCQLTNNAVKSTTRKFFFSIRCKAKTTPDRFGLGNIPYARHRLHVFHGVLTGFLWIMVIVRLKLVHATFPIPRLTLPPVTRFYHEFWLICYASFTHIAWLFEMVHANFPALFAG